MKEESEAPAAGSRKPWAGTIFEDEYEMLAAGITRERANVDRLADALEKIAAACVTREDESACDIPCHIIARTALIAAGRMASNASARSAPKSVSERGGGASLKGK